ncbi:hypothetical protein BC831DRAFT_503007 [Entophlyctis helioformis]|nr:hypothetical protein BC831DRAFT_503007 [Entophlyctis helioformis]
MLAMLVASLQGMAWRGVQQRHIALLAGPLLLLNHCSKPTLASPTLRLPPTLWPNGLQRQTNPTPTPTPTNSIDNVDSAVDVTAGGNSSTPAAAPSVYDGTPYTWGISHSWYLPIGAAVDQTRFIGPVAKGSDLYVVADATSIGVLNATASGFRFNNTMNGGERFKRVGFSQPTIVTLSGRNGRFVGLWDARVGSSTARVDLADLVASDEPAADAGDQAEMPNSNNDDDNDDDDTAYDVAFVYEEDADSPMFATLHAGRYVASFDVLGRRLWAHDLSQSFPDVLFSRLIIGREEYVAIGFDSHSISTSSIHIHCMSITTGETTRSETIALGSPIYAPTLPGTVIVIGDPQNRWIVWRDVDHDLGLYSIEAGNARFMSEYIIGPGSEGFIVNNLVDLGSSDVFMRDFVMQLPSGDWIVRVSEHDSDEPHVSVISLHQVDNPTKILSHEYDTRYYVLVRLYLDTYGQMVVEHIDFETGQVVDAKVLLPTFPGNIVQAWVHFTFPEDHTDKEKGSRSALAPLWFIVGMDENGQYGMYDNADAYKLEFETPSVGDPAHPHRRLCLDQALHKMAARAMPAMTRTRTTRKTAESHTSTSHMIWRAIRNFRQNLSRMADTAKAMMVASGLYRLLPRAKMEETRIAWTWPSWTCWAKGCRASTSASTTNAQRAVMKLPSCITGLLPSRASQLDRHRPLLWFSSRPSMDSANRLAVGRLLLVVCCVVR